MTEADVSARRVLEWLLLAGVTVLLIGLAAARFIGEGLFVTAFEETVVITAAAGVLAVGAIRVLYGKRLLAVAPFTLLLALVAATTILSAIMAPAPLESFFGVGVGADTALLIAALVSFCALGAVHRERPQRAALVVGVALTVLCTVQLLGLFGISAGAPPATPPAGASYEVGVQSVASARAHFVFGSGPNTFRYEWDRFQPYDERISDAWDASYAMGRGFVPTAAFNTGLVGMLLWLVLTVSVLTAAAVVLRRSMRTKRVSWHTTLAVLVPLAFVAVWVTTPTPIVLAATFFAAGVLVGGAGGGFAAYHIYHMNTSRIARLLGVALIIIATIFVVYTLTVRTFAFIPYERAMSALDAGADYSHVTELLDNAIALHGSDRFYRDRTLVEIEGVRRIAEVQETSGATQETQQAFYQHVQLAVEYGREATQINPHDARNWIVRGDVYRFLTEVGVAGAPATAQEYYVSAQERSPRNPKPALLIAHTRLLTGDVAGALERLEFALALKPNYEPALALAARLLGVEVSTLRPAVR